MPSDTFDPVASVQFRPAPPISQVSSDAGLGGARYRECQQQSQQENQIKAETAARRAVIQERRRAVASGAKPEGEDGFRDVAGYEGLYVINSAGVVLSAIFRRKMAVRTDKDGYKLVGLTALDGSRKILRIHRLVATAFVPNPNGKAQVNHINLLKDDNRAENLEWVSIGENAQHWRQVEAERNKPVARDIFAAAALTAYLAKLPEAKAIAAAFATADRCLAARGEKSSGVGHQMAGTPCEAGVCK